MFLSGRVGKGGLGVDAMRGRAGCRVRLVIWTNDRNVRVSERARGVRVYCRGRANEWGASTGVEKVTRVS